MNSPGRGRVNGDPRTLHTVRGKVTPGYMHVPSRFWGNFLTRVHDMNPARLPIGRDLLFLVEEKLPQWGRFFLLQTRHHRSPYHSPNPERHDA